MEGLNNYIKTPVYVGVETFQSQVEQDLRQSAHVTYTHFSTKLREITHTFYYLKIERIKLTVSFVGTQ